MARALFADRDGTIIVDAGYPSDPSQVALMPGAADALRALRARGLRVVVVSNQSGVARGLLTEADVWRVHQRMLSLLEARGATVDAVYYCLHGPDDGCACRKPKPGLLLRAAREHGIDLGGSLVVGDKVSDVEAGHAAGCATALLFSPEGGAAKAADCPVARGWSDVVIAAGGA